MKLSAVFQAQKQPKAANSAGAELKQLQEAKNITVFRKLSTHSLLKKEATTDYKKCGKKILHSS